MPSILALHLANAGLPRSGLTPPTTPPHKPVEDELFKPAEGGKAGAGGGSESVHPPSAKSSPWPGRGQHQRKLPEQTELYAQLRRMGQAGTADALRKFGDHDYCAQSLGAALPQVRGGADGAGAAPPKAAGGRECDGQEGTVATSEDAEAREQRTSPRPSNCRSPPTSEEEEAERSPATRSPSPVLHLCPDSPASKTDSRWVQLWMSTELFHVTGSW